MDQFTFLIIVVVLLVVALGFMAYFMTTQIKSLKTDLKSSENDVLMEWLKDMKSSVEKNTDSMERQMKNQQDSIFTQLKTQRQEMFEQTKQVWQKLDESRDVIGKVQKQLGGIEEFGKDMKDLSNVLKSPKLRGGLGEQFLYEILAASLPQDLYKTQYKFKNGNICDAAIFTDKGIIPIDSKFPMENFKLMLTLETEDERAKAKKLFIRDVKNRIDEISSKYILPDEGTTEQAVIYIPSENVYYELLVNTPEIEEYSKHRNVIMTSPNTLSYFVKIILVAYQQNELQKHAGEILKALSSIKIEAGKFDEDLGVLERHISNTYKAMDVIRTKFTKLFGKIERVEAIGEHVETIDKKDVPLLIED